MSLSLSVSLSASVSVSVSVRKGVFEGSLEVLEWCVCVCVYLVHLKLLQRLLGRFDDVLFGGGACFKAAAPLGVDDEAVTRIGFAEQLLAFAVELGGVDGLDVAFVEDGEAGVDVVFGVVAVGHGDHGAAKDNFDARHGLIFVYWMEG